MKKQWHHLLKPISQTLASRPLCSSSSSFGLKNVTKSNFDASLLDLHRHVRESDFVAIDLEMTGVTSAPWRESFEFDRYDVKYLKVKDSAQKFAVVQFGVCPFRWDSSNHSFVAHPHNFYIFPRRELPLDGPSHQFLCQTTSLDFLAKYEFDFNACIHEGVSYLSRVQEDEALRRLKSAYEDELSDSQHNLEECSDLQGLSVADVLFTERMKNRISEWRDGLLGDRNGASQFQESSNDSKQPLHTIFFKMRPALALNGFTSHQQHLIHMVARKHFKDLAYVRASGENSCVQKLIVYTESKDDKDLLMKEVKGEHHKEAELKIKTAVGFRHVIDLLSTEKKLIVGHNCFLDFAHTYRKFFGPLPLSVEEFVSSIHNYFPLIIDTKILLNANSILQNQVTRSGTSLAKAFAILCPHIASMLKPSDVTFKQQFVKVEVQVDEMSSSNWNSGAKHEAGYDAFMTGCVFAQACTHLNINFNLHSASESFISNQNLQKHINLLYLSWNSGDIIDLATGNMTVGSLASFNVKKRYAKVLFSNIVVIWGIPSNLKAKDIRTCISKVFGLCSVTSVYHLDETAVFVQFSKADMVSGFLDLKHSLERKNDPISVLHPFSKLLGGKICAGGYEIYKEICRSPISEILFADQAEAVAVTWKKKSMESRKVVETREREDFSNENLAVN